MDHKLILMLCLPAMSLIAGFVAGYAVRTRRWEALILVIFVAALVAMASFDLAHYR